jgi:Yip1 domain
MSTAPAAVTPEVPALSQVERVIDTFVAPTKTFTDIRRSASWWLPWLLGAIVGLALVYIVDTKVGMDKVTENQIQLQPKQAAKLDQLPADQRASRMELSAKITRMVAYGFPVLNLFVVAVMAAILMGTFNFGFGAELKFWQCYAISMYAFLPGVIKALLVILTLMIGGGENFTFQNQLASNLGVLFDPSRSPYLYSVASSIDLFNIWILVLTGIGYSCVTRVKRGTCMGVVFGWWAVVTLGSSAFGSLFS